MANTLAVSILLRARDEASSVIGGVGNAVSHTRSAIANNAAQIQLTGRAMTVAGGAIVTALGMASRASASFNVGMGEVSTLVDTASVDMDKLKNGVNDVAMATGIQAQNLTGALYQAISAGVDAGESIEFLGVASRAAVAGVTDAETAVNGITTIINAYGLETQDAARVSDAMFSAVKAGKTTFAELSQSMFQVGPAAAAANVSLEETMAAISTLTAAGVPTSVATTQIRAALVGLMRPSEELSSIFQAQGYATAEAAIRSQGLKFALDTVMEAAGGSSSKLTQLLGSVEAVGATQVLAGTGSQKFAADLQAQANAAGAAETAYKKLSKEGAASFNRLQETGAVMTRAMGDALLPTLADLADAAAPVVRAFADLAKTPMGRTIVMTTAALGGLMTVMGPVLMALPALSAGWGMLSGLFAAAPAVIAGIGPAIVGAFAAIGPAGWVMLAVGALAGGVYLVVKNWKSITGFFSRLWTGIVDGVKRNWPIILATICPAAGVGVLVAKHWGTIVPWFGDFWERIKGHFTAGIKWIGDAGKRLWEAFVDGLKRTALAPLKLVLGALQKIRDLLPHSDARTGPLSSLTAAGLALPVTFATGIARGLPIVAQRAQELAKAATPPESLASSWTIQPGTVSQLDKEALAAQKKTQRERNRALLAQLKPITPVQPVGARETGTRAMSGASQMPEAGTIVGRLAIDRLLGMRQSSDAPIQQTFIFNSPLYGEQGIREVAQDAFRKTMTAVRYAR